MIQGMRHHAEKKRLTWFNRSCVLLVKISKFHVACKFKVLSTKGAQLCGVENIDTKMQRDYVWSVVAEEDFCAGNYQLPRGTNTSIYVLRFVVIRLANQW